MPHLNEEKVERRRMRKRSVECDGYLRGDGLWEVEARLVDTKPFTQSADDRGEFRVTPFTISICVLRSTTP